MSSSPPLSHFHVFFFFFFFSSAVVFIVSIHYQKQLDFFSLKEMFQIPLHPQVNPVNHKFICFCRCDIESQKFTGLILGISVTRDSLLASVRI